MIDWPRHLIRDIARRRAVLFIGSGVSKNSIGLEGKRPPTWTEFLQLGISRCPKPVKHIQSLVKSNDLLTACEILKVKLDDEWSDLVASEFTTPRYQPSDLHKDLFALDLRLVMTQNFDKIYDTYAQTESNGTVYVKNYYDTDTALVLRGDHRAVIKAHGTIDEPSKMIFTRKEYSEARYRYAAFYSCMDALALTHTFMFVGCGLSDPDVQLFLERYAQLYPTGKPHCMIMPRGTHQDVKDSMRHNLNVRIVEYSAANFHQELAQSIHELVALVEADRSTLADTQDW